MKKFGVITTSRADYGLMVPLLKELKQRECMDYQLFVTGSHLVKKHGYTLKFIENDGFVIHGLIQSDQLNDSENDVCRKISDQVAGFSKVYVDINIDAIIVLGDRYELWGACIAAVVHRIPIIHIHGGELTEGAIDEKIRHSITKMASIHFPSTDLYRKRILQMGEQPQNVFAVGAMGIDNIMSLERLSIESLKDMFPLDYDKKLILMTYHPVTTMNVNDGKGQVLEILKSLHCDEYFTIITMPNADAGGETIHKAIQEYVSDKEECFKFSESLGQQVYLSLMDIAFCMIGNSSSGIIESASFKLPVINIGDRQKGRIRPDNVVDVDCNQNAISDALELVAKKAYRSKLIDLENPYGDGGSAKRITDVLEKIDFSNKQALIGKQFFDIDFTI